MRHLLGTVAAIALLAPATAATADPSFTYVPQSLAQASILFGPWTLHEHGRYINHDASGIVPNVATPYNPPTTAFGTPYKDLCTMSGQRTANFGKSVMQPYYFPFVRARGEVLEGLFDYRPRNQQESTVSAISTDGGATWRFTGEALALNPYCPWDQTDPDNNNLNIDGVKTAYGSDGANAGDNGLGHPFAMSVHGVKRIYHLNRASGHIDNDQLVVHSLHSESLDALRGLPAFGYVSPLASSGYPTLQPGSEATAGLIDPDAILGAVHTGHQTTVVYVSKNTVNGESNFAASEKCPSTPGFALTNLVNKKPRKPNHDVISIKVATTTDGINFADAGTATGLSDPKTVALNGIRWLGSGSLIRISDGRYGLFFGAGNCIDNDSDGFHFIGYAETVAPVRTAADLLQWKVVNGFDNPILSTDTVVDTSQVPPRRYPLNPPLINVSGADALSAAEVAPFTPPAPGLTTNFFSGRVYDPQVVYTDEQTVTIVFAGYNTPQPSNNLGDYRSIGRFKLRVPRGYFAQPFDEDDR